MNGSFSFATDQPVQYGCSTCQTKLNHLCPDICRQMLTYVMIVNVCLTYVAKCVDFPAHLSMTCSSMLDLCGHIYMRHMFHICQPYRQQMSTRLKMSRAGWQGLLPVRAVRLLRSVRCASFLSLAHWCRTQERLRGMYFVSSQAWPGMETQVGPRRLMQAPGMARWLDAVAGDRHAVEGGRLTANVSFM